MSYRSRRDEIKPDFYNCAECGVKVSRSKVLFQHYQSFCSDPCNEKWKEKNLKPKKLQGNNHYIKMDLGGGSAY